MADGFSFEEDDKKGGSATPQSGFTWESDKTAPAAESPSTSQPTEPSTWEKLTRGYNPDVEQFAEHHSTIGPVVRGLDAAGGAAMGMIPSVLSSIRHPIDTANAVGQSIEDWTTKPGAMLKAAPSVLPEALGQGIGNVGAGEFVGAAASRIPDLIPEGAGNYAASKLREPATARQSALGRPGTIKNVLPPSMQRWSVPPWLIPKGEIGTPTNPGWFSEIPARMPSVGTDAARAEAATQGGGTIRVIPEPREPFEGEKPGYMASVPRKTLRPLASSAKPGAGAQLQQLGEKVIYAPREGTGYAKPRTIQKVGD
jgi:hypothetical protein